MKRLLFALVLMIFVGAVCLSCAPEPNGTVRTATIAVKKPIPGEIGQMFGEMPDSGSWATWYSWGPSDAQGGLSRLLEEPRGQYHFENVTEMLDEAQRRDVKVYLNVLAYTSDIDGYRYFLTWTPTGYPDDIILRDDPYYAQLPPYASTDWRTGYERCVVELAKEIDDHPALVGISMGGMDGETQMIKDAGMQWAELARQAPGGQEKGFGLLITEAMDQMSSAYLQTQVFLNCAPGGNARMTWANHAASLDPPIGLKHSGMRFDLDSHRGYGEFVGSWDHIKVYSRTLPIWIESAYGLGSDSDRWAAMLTGLNYYPDAMDVHPMYQTLGSEFLDWAGAHLGKTIDDTPSAWAWLRDMEYPYISWGKASVSGLPGNASQWMSVTGGDRVCGRNLANGKHGEKVCDLVIPILGVEADLRSRQSRLGDRFIIDVDDGFVRSHATLKLVYLDIGKGQVTITVGGMLHTFGRTGTNAWQEFQLDLGAFDPRLDIVVTAADPLCLQWVEVSSGTMALTATPTKTFIPIVTSTLTVTPAPTVTTKIPTAKATQTPWIVTATYDAQPTRTGTPTPPWQVRYPTLQAEALNDNVKLEGTAYYLLDVGK